MQICQDFTRAFPAPIDRNWITADLVKGLVAQRMLAIEARARAIALPHPSLSVNLQRVSMSPDTQTHTLPLALMAILVLCGTAALMLNYRRRRQLQDTVEEQFKGFRAKAVALMDQLDALRQRHKTLPSTDPDFTAPMTGATLTLYNAVETDLNALWDRWLKVMELWDHAQKLVRSGSGLAVKQAEEARMLLGKGDVDELLRQSRSCKERLDRLNQGHEQAREALKENRAELQSLMQSVDLETGVLLPSDPQRQQRITSAEALYSQAESMITADPIGAQEIMKRWHQSRAELEQRLSHEFERHQRSPRAYSLLDDLASAADHFRNSASKLRLTNVLGLFVRFWLVVWGFSLLIGLFNVLMPLIVILLGFGLIIAGFWAIWQMITFWFWYGLWQVRR
jgi:hypothetical protein